jgi:hypothetical protein
MHGQAHSHPHGAHHHARPAPPPTLSLLRLSGLQRLVGLALVLALLWLAVIAVIF